MILADDVVTEKEKKILKRFAIEAGFEDKAVNHLIDLLLKGITDNESEDALLEKFKAYLFK